MRATASTFQLDDVARGRARTSRTTRRRSSRADRARVDEQVRRRSRSSRPRSRCRARTARGPAVDPALQGRRARRLAPDDHLRLRGYGSSQHACFSAGRLAWLERGGVIAIVSRARRRREGPQVARRWRRASKQAERHPRRDRVRRVPGRARSTRAPARLAIEGGSMGGILIGRALDERPDLFAAAHIAVGIVNPLRILAAENGANQIARARRSARPRPAIKSILAMDPYLNVKPKTAYPAVIFTIGLNDHRVAPWMTGKMAARLQATTTSEQPILDPRRGRRGPRHRLDARSDASPSPPTSTRSCCSSSACRFRIDERQQQHEARLDDRRRPDRCRVREPLRRVRRRA